MVNFIHSEATALISKRSGEQKLGEVIFLPDSWEALSMFKGKFVIVGIPEDIGVRANYGRPGAAKGWERFLPAFLNIQANHFMASSEIAVLGAVNVYDLQVEAEQLDTNQDITPLRNLVEQLDERVFSVISNIVALGKIPIVIGGGHNNAFPILKAFGKSAPINCLNIDPHADCRALEGRHSGNPFSYAYEQEYLNKYVLLGMNESYNNSDILTALEKMQATVFSYEDIFVKNVCSIDEVKTAVVEELTNTKVGFELDLDSITDFPVSAVNPSGFSPEMIRSLVYFFAGNLQPIYFHLPEFAPELASNNDNRYAKLLAALVTDFIKGNLAG